MPNRFTKVGAQQVALLGGNAKMASDPKRNQTVLHLSTLGAIRGEQNNTFVDDSPNRYTITRTGNVAPSTFSPYGDSWSNYFDGNGDYLSIADNAALELGSGDFTIECWFNSAVAAKASVNSDGSYHVSIARKPWAYDFVVLGTASGMTGLHLTGFITDTTTIWVTSSFSFTQNTWYHLSVCRQGTTIKLFVNGNMVGQNTSYVGTIQNNTQLLHIGGGGGGVEYSVSGYISNFRLVTGAALYTANFTPSKTPLTAVSGTSLLTCASNRFQDKSSNNFTITPNGNVAVKTASPFPQAREFKKPQRGWCVPFNGSTQRLETPAASVANGLQLGTSDFTIECWVKAKPQPGMSYARIIDTQSVSGSVALQLVCGPEAGSPHIYFGVSTTVANSWQGIYLQNVLNNTWNHVSITRVGSKITGYVNGIYQAEMTLTAGNINLNYTSPITVGCYKDPSTSTYGSYFSGKISNVMIVKKALYSGNFVPMGSPRTADQNGTLPVLLTCQGGTVMDYSYASQTLTSAGSLVVDSDGPFDQDDESSYYFDGNGDYLQIADNNALELGSGDFTIETWVNPTAYGYLDGNGNRISMIASKIGAFNFYLQGTATSWQYLIYSQTDSVNWSGATASYAFENNKWYHIAFTRQGNVGKLFVDGVLLQTNSSFTTNIPNGTGVVRIGMLDTTNASWYDYFTGYLSNLRLVTGAALYTANFTPSRKPLGIAASGSTALLTCRGRTAADQSNNNLTVTANGNAGVASLSPFRSLDYNGMSYYFDGAGDYLVGPSNNASLDFGTGDFTIDCWVMLTSSAATARVIACYVNAAGTANVSNSAWYLGLDSSGWWITCNSGSTQYALNGAQTIRVGVWYHVAFARRSGTQSLYVNGVSLSTGAANVNLNAPAGRVLNIGRYFNSTPREFGGYISDLRIIKGTSLYSSNFTPPTTPRLPESGTSLMLNAYPTIYDTTRKNAIETLGSYNGANGGPPWSTRTERYSFYFNGTNDYINIPSSPDFDFGTGDFTIETWLYLAGNSALDAASLRVAALASCYNNAGQGWEIYIGGNSTTTGLGLGIENWSSSTYTAMGRDFSISQLIWCHVAVTRKSGIVRIFLNGVQQGTDQTFTSNMSGGSANCWIGALNYTGYNRYLNGYIHDLRITKGTARYTSNFTLPKLPLPIK